jgi:hypothetical protein
MPTISTGGSFVGFEDFSPSHTNAQGSCCHWLSNCFRALEYPLCWSIPTAAIPRQPFLVTAFG